jgi:glycosyltransferase involved in cell wall biosynthesis
MSISIILPVYNEEGNIEKVVNSTLSCLNRITKDFEIILINDGSSDNTGTIIKTLSENNKNLKYIFHNQNLGYGASLRSGFNIANYPLIFFMDCDGQFDISDINKLLKDIRSADIVIGKRKLRQDRIYRIMLTKVFNSLANSIFCMKFNDISCGFKLIKNSVLKSLEIKSQSGIINLEILVKAARTGYIVKEVEINHFPRIRGKSKGTRIKNIIRKIKELVILYFDLKKSKC